MSKFVIGALAVLVASAGLQAPAGAASAGQEPTGVWRNPKNSVHIKIQPCGANVCGTVIWANARALEKARRAGTPDLVGRQLLQEFRAEGAGTWQGRVFVPDIARTVSGKLKKAGPNSVVASGCLLGRFVCKSQTWTRIG